MNICILTHCFYPSRLRGGPTTSMTNMVKALSNDFDVSVITIIRDKDGTRYTNVDKGCNRLFNSNVYYLDENTPKAFYKTLYQIQK